MCSNKKRIIAASFFFFSNIVKINSHLEWNTSIFSSSGLFQWKPLFHDTDLFVWVDVCGISYCNQETTSNFNLKSCRGNRVQSSLQLNRNHSFILHIRSYGDSEMSLQHNQFSKYNSEIRLRSNEYGIDDLLVVGSGGNKGSKDSYSIDTNAIYTTNICTYEYISISYALNRGNGKNKLDKIQTNKDNLYSNNLISSTLGE